MPARISIDPERIAEFCRRNHIRRLSLFGSVLREDFTPQSDVDFLVEFEPGTRVGYLELTEMIGRKADLRTPAELSRYFRQEVVDTAEVLHEQA